MYEESRYWLITAHIQNMRNAGLTEDQIKDPQYIADFFLNTWHLSGKNRIGYVTVCISAKGTYHLHAALCGEKTSLNAVANTMFHSNVQKITGGKKTLMEYIRKEGKFTDKSEVVLAEAFDDNMVIKQGYRSDIETINNMIENGYNPEEILSQSLSYCRFEKAIRKKYSIKKSKEDPICKTVYVEWHIGDSGTGKTHYYEKLCNKYGEENIYIVGHLKFGWIDDYVDKGCPKILFIDDLAKPFELQELLGIIDSNSKKSINGRYRNTYPYWEKVFIASLEPPEALLDYNTHTPYYEKLKRKVDFFVYQYKDAQGFHEFSLPSEQYTNYNELKQTALLNQQYSKPCENIND